VTDTPGVRERDVNESAGGAGVVAAIRRWVAGRGAMQTALLVAAVVALAVLSLGFFELADDVAEGDTTAFDEWAVRSLRQADDPAVPVGPAWLREAGIDVTALGSVAVVVLLSSLVGGFLLLHGRRGLVCILLAALLGGLLLNTGLKHFYDRRRPDVVPHLREVTTPSFPSGHAALSAVAYPTLGVMCARAVTGPAVRAYCVAAAALLPLLVGVSRIYLGVHYPTDVLAGWMVGACWAIACWVITSAAFVQTRVRVVPSAR
jgi:undecaprenyl-diphosphatase